MNQQIISLIAPSSGSVNWELELIRIVPSVLVAGVVGVAGFLIGRRQVRIAEGQLQLAQSNFELAQANRDIATAKLKLDLFDRRHSVYLKAVGFIQSVLRAQRFDDPMFEKFRLVIADSEFLFGSDIAGYLKELNKQAEHWKEMLEEARENHMSQDRFGEICEDLADYFSHELTILHNRFSEYLTFEKWR